MTGLEKNECKYPKKKCFFERVFYFFDLYVFGGGGTDMKSSKQQQTIYIYIIYIIFLLNGRNSSINVINIGLGECSSDGNFQRFYLCLPMQVFVQNGCTKRCEAVWSHMTHLHL